ncbi:hypothetical protein JG687_00012569 [Phytophthora cactorum]|uniref:Uncharacterized protein n=1 Tax=Phytophthora cactorum TaxID=29920 RepID=A0A8T1U1E8_9STRA|nr:hypothetical protein JG687_00012569 [Phytophthora cactorum]
MCERTVEEIEAAYCEPIFREVYDDELDLHRVQADLLNVPTTVQEIYNHIEEMLEAANDVWRLDPTGGHALISHAGSQDQAVHCNFPAFETVQALLVHVTVRASFIVAVLDDTFLHVYPGFFWAEAEKMVTFRGDPAYAGAWYRTRTVRLHCYVLVDGIEQAENTTEAVVFQTFRCERCLAGAYSANELTAHRRVCATSSYS